jgi:hypothetical protein
MKQILTLKRESLGGPMSRDQLHQAGIDLLREVLSDPLGQDLDLDEADLYPVFVLKDFCIDLAAVVPDEDPATLTLAIRDPDPLAYALRLHTAILEAHQLLVMRPALRLGAQAQQAIDILLRLARALPAMAGQPMPA